MKQCVLSVLGFANADNEDGANSNNIFIIKDKKLFVPVVTLSKHLSKGFERSLYWNIYKTNSEDKNAIDDYRYFLQSNFVGVISLFALSKLK